MTKTDFFTLLKDLVKDTTSLNICITKVGDNKYACSIISKSKEIDEYDSKSFAPIILTGTVDELNEGFFNVITKPIEETNGLLVNIELHEKELKAEKDKLKAEKAKRDEKKLGKAKTETPKSISNNELDEEDENEAAEVEKIAKAPKAKTAKEMIDEKLDAIQIKINAEDFETATIELKAISKESKEPRIFQMLMSAINSNNAKKAPKLFEEPVVVETPSTPDEKEIQADNTNPINPE